MVFRRIWFSSTDPALCGTANGQAGHWGDCALDLRRSAEYGPGGRHGDELEAESVGRPSVFLKVLEPLFDGQDRSNYIRMIIELIELIEHNRT